MVEGRCSLSELHYCAGEWWLGAASWAGAASTREHEPLIIPRVCPPCVSVCGCIYANTGSGLSRTGVRTQYNVCPRCRGALVGARRRAAWRVGGHGLASSPAPPERGGPAHACRRQHAALLRPPRNNKHFPTWAQRRFQLSRRPSRRFASAVLWLASESRGSSLHPRSASDSVVT